MTAFNMNKPEIEQAAIEFKKALINWKSREKIVRVASIHRPDWAEKDILRCIEVETEIMGASFRSIDQVLGLAGCDLLTVAPNLLAALEQDTREVKAQLSASDIASTAAPLNSLSETEFRDQIEHDLMATQLLQGGIDGFIKARQQLNTLLRQSFGLDEEISA